MSGSRARVGLANNAPRRLGALGLVLWFAVSAPAAAHDQRTVQTLITVTDTRLDVVFMLHHSDLVECFDASAVGDRAASAASAVADRFHLRADGRRLAFEIGDPFTVDDDGRSRVSLPFTTALDRMPREVTIVTELADKLGDRYVHLLQLRVGDRLYQAVLPGDHQEHRILVGGTPPLLTQAWSFVVLGVEHIFVGYDHILFLVALVAVGGRLIDLVRLVTAFTVAHSVTLIVAALGLVVPPSHVVEAGIAASIVFVAGENLFRERPRRRWLLTFAFGLIHGFGFANVLRELGLPPHGLIVSLLAFNVGVEIGQVAILLLLFPSILWLARKRWHRTFIIALSAVVMLAGLGWLIERTLGIPVMP